MTSQNKLHLLHFKLETTNKNLILKNEIIHPCTIFKPLVFICAALLCARNFSGVLPSYSHLTHSLQMYVVLRFGNKLFSMTWDAVQYTGQSGTALLCSVEDKTQFAVLDTVINSQPATQVPSSCISHLFPNTFLAMAVRRKTYAHT
jgi:hypothetical protein